MEQILPNILEVIIYFLIVAGFFVAQAVIKYFKMRNLTPLERQILEDLTQCVSVLLVNHWHAVPMSVKLERLRNIYTYIEANSPKTEQED
jgi:hypothetical protein